MSDNQDKKLSFVGWIILAIASTAAYFGSNAYVDSYIRFLKSLGER